MVTYNPVRNSPTWQQIKPTQSEPDSAGIAVLIQEEWQSGTTYLQLSRVAAQPQSRILRQLFEQSQSHAACLKGIYTLMTGQHIAFRSEPASHETVSQALRRCYGREMRCLTWYEAGTGSREYGPVFDRLADRKREQCRQLLELIGIVQKTADGAGRDQ